MTRAALTRQQGLSLIELMVAMLISLVLLAGVLQVFLSSKQLYASNTALARIQENGRFAAQFLSYGLRNAGFKGECVNGIEVRLNVTDEEEQAYNPLYAIEGWDNGTSPTNLSGTVRAQTDSFSVRSAGNGSEFLTKNGTKTSTPSLNIEGSHNVEDGEIVLVGSTSGCDLFQNANNGNASVLQQKGGNVSPGNVSCNGQSESCWSSGVEGKYLSIYKLTSETYFLNDHDDRLPSLSRSRLNDGGSWTKEELVEGVIDMQVQYLLEDGDQYISANSSQLDNEEEWKKIVSARAYLIVVSSETNVVDEARTFFFAPAKGITKEDQYASYADGAVTVKERRLAQVFATTVAIRNRLP
ncbi:PilW family protein [Stutzerimonas stutzeri]|uniref:PilW family protein n=1 Tax=Stutzerimonas stutzeri TaxID=316 RepID=UPI00210F1B9B|nr:PilW family protein [Stutzerimonas stutzeri]MCQ4322065.1 PilW family protein [Stutzerimonas stutzeri]